MEHWEKGRICDRCHCEPGRPVQWRFPRLRRKVQWAFHKMRLQ